MRNILFVAILLGFISCAKKNEVLTAPQWDEVEIVFHSKISYKNPYTDVDVYVEFKSDAGLLIKRPAFWDGGDIWKVRFASPIDSGLFSYISYSSDTLNSGLHSVSGSLKAIPYLGDNELIKNGLLKMSPGKRNVVHASGKPFMIIGDTPWAMPFRASTDDVKVYASKRAEQGFNIALLMSINSDRGAEGPRGRKGDGAFDIGFEDLKQGHINQLNPAYFQYFDSLVTILLQHGIVPVYQPVFHGFGWKGLDVLGLDMNPEEYARYCKYLLARYGARHAFWLVSGDGQGDLPGVKEGGEIVELWDDYKQPAGIHYNPFDDYCPENQPQKKCFHYNKKFQNAEWLDFQWAQTGHSGEHLIHKVERMYNNYPVKAVANGEPTYEGIRDSMNGSGLWQMHEAWLQLFAGGTMGVVYGAGGLWQWKLRAAEPGWESWANSNNSWSDALQLPGANYVGLISKAFTGYDYADMEKQPEWASNSYCLAKKARFYVSWLPEGGKVTISNLVPNLAISWFNTTTGEFISNGITNAEEMEFVSPSGNSFVLFIGNKSENYRNEEYAVKGLAHINLQVVNIDSSLQFYCNILGFEKTYYTEFVRNGNEKIRFALVQKGSCIIELVDAENKNDIKTNEAGVIDHFAIDVDNLPAFLSYLKSLKIKVVRDYFSREDLMGGFHAAFILGPDGEKVELFERLK